MIGTVINELAGTPKQRWREGKRRAPFPGSVIIDKLMRRFLKAEWRYLLILNYVVEPALLRSFIPNGVELDIWNSKAYISIVGFLFLRTRVLGLRMPWHENFEEVNLRFYVRRRAPEGWRRGVVFIKEIVPRRLIAAVARVCYNEPYSSQADASLHRY